MPQKPVFSRSPILTVPHCFPAAGTVRTPDERIAALYQKAGIYKDQPCLWEGLFRLACLVKNNPAEEPVTGLINEAIANTESGAFKGSVSEQISIARAAFALFEYNTDRAILKRIACWLRYIEIESDHLLFQDGILYRPADLMELLVRFYQVSGVKSVLRLCARLRAEAFDWTTALHTYQQAIPIRAEEKNDPYCLPAVKTDEIDYIEKEKLINHAEILADGVRYTLFAGLYSGHRQDLSAGKAVWGQLIRHHRALCGGTTGDPFLSGNASDQPVNNMALAAWTEAFGSQMMLSDFPWASDEMIRIVRNGLDDCLNRNDAYRTQHINTIHENDDTVADPAPWYARLTRAVASVYRHAVSITENGFRINYTIPGRYLIMSRKKPLIIRMDNFAVHFQCKSPVSARTEIYLSPISTCSVTAIREGQTRRIYAFGENNNHCIQTDTDWHDQDCILFDPKEQIICDDTHHQGTAFIVYGRLLCMPCNEKNYARAVCGKPVCTGQKMTVETKQAEKWHIRNSQPADIPVLPETKGEPAATELKLYPECPCRITMFPRAK